MTKSLTCSETVGITCTQINTHTHITANFKMVNVHDTSLVGSRMHGFKSHGFLLCSVERHRIMSKLYEGSLKWLSFSNIVMN